jgi:hypothetical protein
MKTPAIMSPFTLLFKGSSGLMVKSGQYLVLYLSYYLLHGLGMELFLVY